MKFVQRDLGPAAEISGGGQSVWLRELSVLGGALLVLTVALWMATGWVTELLLPLVSIDTERKVFGAFQPADREESAGLSAPLAARRDRLANVLVKLAADPAIPPLDYRLIVMRAQGPNAFAFPGGAIGVTRGLLEIIGDDEVAIAFVLGHELGHFAQRDHLRGIGRQLGRSLVWALIFGRDGADLLSPHVSSLLDLRYSRGQESAADRFGLELVHRIYGTTEGTDRLFVWLEQRDRNPAWLEMLETHPDAGGRLRALREHAGRLAAAKPR